MKKRASVKATTPGEALNYFICQNTQSRFAVGWEYLRPDEKQTHERVAAEFAAWFITHEESTAAIRELPPRPAKKKGRKP